jgi:hypothetical protein
LAKAFFQIILQPLFYAPELILQTPSIIRHDTSYYSCLFLFTLFSSSLQLVRAMLATPDPEASAISVISTK